ncbi:MAG: hypothetical protein JWM14_830 [Chitinophagaceae bacterium]|nr:hypothetical protein [Chitinophagaceae bacterium]
MTQMKQLLFFILLFIFPFSLSAQTSKEEIKFKNLVSLEPQKDCYTFKAKDMTVSICKGDDASQLAAYGPKSIWLGRNYPNLDYSDLVVTFSKPVTFVEFNISHFDNDEMGKEQLENFHFFAGDKTELTNGIIQWTANSDKTSYDRRKQIIKGTADATGAEASGKLTLSSPTPFTKIVFRQTVLLGAPNGVHLDEKFTFSKDTIIIPPVIKAEDLIKEDSLSSAIATQKAQAEKDEIKISFKRLADLKPQEDCYTFQADDMIVTVCKGDATSQLAVFGTKSMWLGKNAPDTEHSDVIITFSKPVTSVNFNISHFNNDETSGDEQLEDFRFYTDKGEMNGKVSWSGSEMTTFDSSKRIIKGTKGAWGPEASGKLTMYSTTPFTKISFRQTELRGAPNGVILDDSFTFKKDTVIVTPVSAIDTLPVLAKDIVVQEIKEEQVLKKDTIPDTTTTKDITAQKNVVKKEVKPKPIKKKTPAPVTPVKKTTPAPVVVVKKTIPPKEPVKKTIVKTETPKKTVTPKPVVKKKAIPKPPVKEEIDTLITYKLSQIKQLKVGEKIKLEKIYFKQSLPELLPDSYPELDTLADILKRYPTLELELQGHTDNQGVAVLNQKLSTERAEAVKQYLIAKGIASTRLTGKGFGSSRPYTDNESEEHRHKNRRVECMITKR